MTLAKRLHTGDAEFIDTKAGTVYQSRLTDMPEKPDPILNTLSKNFLEQVKKQQDAIAMRKKRYGIWQEYSWNDVYDHVSNVFHGLIALGLKTDETVIVIGENDPEMYWSQIATHAASAMTCSVFADALPDPDLVYVAHSTNATFIIAHDQEQVDKALMIKEKVPQIRKVIYWEDKGMWSYDDDWLMSFEEFEAFGATHREKNKGLFEKSIAATEPENTIVLSMTSGTTSLPKFAMITHYDIMARHFLNRRFAPLYPEDNWLSFSPMAWLTEQAFGFTPFLIEGFKVNFPEGPETVQTDLREISPVGLLFPSRVWENLASTVRFRLNDSTWFNRKLFDFFLPIAYQAIDLEDDNQPIPANLKFMRQIGEITVFEPLRDKLGLVNARNVLTAGAMLSPDVIRFFRAMGVELRQLYASTETIGTLHLQGDVKLETVGVIVPGVEIKITEEQEILVRSEGLFAGYYGKPDKTAEVIDKEGWYHTGDAGYMREDGHLVYLERVKDMTELSNGHRFSPQFIEGRLKFSPYIQDIMTIGGFDMDFVSAIVVINFENVSRWAEKRGLTFTTFVDLSQRPEVYDLVKKDIQRVNESLPENGRLKKFVILHKEFDADEGELTRTRKLKRRTLYQKYDDILEALYGDTKAVSMRAEVKYRDGREGVIETELQVADV
ncbi:MAG: AMP-binding protein [Phototrophicaceae bacterium]